MKKRGVTYTEILVAITIFSLGVVPLMLSLNSSFEATVFNRDYTKALEYNAQLIEEISAMMPTRVAKDSGNLDAYTDLEELYTDVTSMLEERDEESASTKGIYQLAEWDTGVNKFQFVGDKVIDRNFYRKINLIQEVETEGGDMVRGIGSKEEGLIILPVEIETLKTSEDSTGEGQYRKIDIKNHMRIKLWDKSKSVLELREEGDASISLEGNNNEELLTITLGEEINFIRVILIGSVKDLENLSGVVAINNGSNITLNSIANKSSYGNKVYETEKMSTPIPQNNQVTLKVTKKTGTKISNLKMEYYLLNKK